MEGGSPSPARSPDARLGVDTRLWAKALFTALYSLIFALGTAGNALSVRVVLKGRPGRLRYHVLSLALSALLLLLVGVPTELYNFVWSHYPWVFGDLGCRAYYFVRELCTCAAVLGGAGLSAERCLAVCQPLRARRLLALVWAASLGLALPMAVITGQRHALEKAGGEPEPASRVCTALVSRAALQGFIQVNVLVSFVLPLALTAFLNGVTVSHLVALSSQVPPTSAPGSPVPNHMGLMSEERRALPQEGHAGLVRHKDSSRLRGLQHSVQVLRAIVAVYVVCWMPYHARKLMYCYVSDDGWTGTLYSFYHYFYLVTNTLVYVSSAVTPVLYNAVSSSFRKLFLEALGSLCRERRAMKPWPPGSPGAPPEWTRLQALRHPSDTPSLMKEENEQSRQ